MDKFIYLDSASMHPVLPRAREAFLSAPFGNPSSEHAAGQEAREALEQAREKIAKLMDCEPEEVYFTSTATEAAALAMYSIGKTNLYGLVVTDFEHHAITENAEEHVNRGCKPYAVASMLYNNETGAFISRPEFSGVRFWLCDATTAVGHVPVSFRDLGCDYLIADGIKFGSVPGAAFLIAKNGAPLSPMICGGGQERGMRSGTENVPAICAMAAALEWQTEHMEENTEKLSKLADIFVTELSEIPSHLWNTPLDRPHLPHILNISFPGVDAHALTLLLSKEGVMVSAGAACSNGKNEPSHVIMSMFHDEQRARSAIRISLSHQNTMEECETAAKKIAECVAYLRSIS